MRLLLLGGGRFVGRAVAEAAHERGWHLSVLNRGRSGVAPHADRVIVADRADASALDVALAQAVAEEGPWDLVVDTWSGAPAVATATASALTGRARRYGYVSSSSVYRWGEHVNEESPLVDGDAEAEPSDYAADKRGAELGIVASFPDALLVRAGLILGPHEDIGRLPWWLARIAKGGRFVAPGDPDRPLQYVDARDLASWMLEALERGLSGPYDVVGRSGAITTGRLLEECVSATGADATPVWIPQEALAEAGVQPWTELPCWTPDDGEFAGFLESDPSKVFAAGFSPRPWAETVADTWRWLQADGPAPQRADRPVHGLPQEKERALLGDG